MDENKKAKHDAMTKILGWGMAVYFLVFGYSINQSSFFELRPLDEQTIVANAKKNQADVLRKQASSNNSANSNANSEAAEMVKAAELDLEAKEIEEEKKDGISRAIGLIIAATIFSVFYFLVIFIFYQKFETEMADYLLPRKIALIYAAFIGASILTTAVMTAVN